ncbi:MAG: Maf family nucleotide pyrophosphatase [Candidatus Nanopelagicales bacterium]|nr:Maf family nucleotide pyrophosphatase [Candidatus Nanopelagicales bacterium]MCF8539465.1 Maf family nucleotide pyrophosphatase [Candidatus Nanopelagicales bacterium]MCF8551448.1 Maf family nucleotide pyrophosphatase [Candidatus Nanopelagicales bacterium]
MTTVVLASASPARLTTLRNAGVTPQVQVSQVDEEQLQADNPHLSPAQLAQLLAQAKCEEVARTRTEPDQVIIGCDSVFEIDGQPFGKPETPEVARERWSRMMNNTGTLHTGHHLIYIDSDGAVHHASATASTDVTIGELSEAEMQAYLASGEPLQVAGGFTIDSLGGPFVQSVNGDPSNVVGISLPTVRQLITGLGLTWTDLWDPSLIQPIGSQQ